MLILPLVFLVWGLTGLIGSRGLGVDFALFVATAAAGGVGGAALAALGPQPRLISESDRMAMPGSAIPLTLILISFACKYVGNVALAIDADVSQRALLVSLMTGGRRRFRRAVLGPHADAVPARAFRGGRAFGSCLRRQAHLASLGSAPGSRSLMIPSEGPVSHDHQH